MSCLQFIQRSQGRDESDWTATGRPEFVEHLAQSIRFISGSPCGAARITGWAQVSYRYGSSDDDKQIRVGYDLYYVNHMSPLLDIRMACYRPSRSCLHSRGSNLHETLIS